jgi:hypothetical protein
MNKSLWLSLIWMVFTVLLNSCNQTTPRISPVTENETENDTVQVLVQETSQTSKPKLANFSVSGLTITPKEVTAGSSVTIEVLVTNSGELSGTYDVIFKIDDKVESTETVTLDSGTSQKVTYILKKYTAKIYLVNVNGQSGTFVVKAPPPAPVVKPPPPSLSPLDAFMKGMAFCDWNPYDEPSFGYYRPPGTDKSLQNLADTGVNWISLLVRVNQETIRSTTISSNSTVTVKDSDLIRVVNLAHNIGIRVALVPCIQLSNDPDHWWGEIGTSFASETQWQEWFTSYREFINHYATFAQEAEVDLFYVGSELPGVTHREDDWRRVVQEVRERYTGLISYDSVHWGRPQGECARIKWWDAVDYVATDVWYTLTNKNDPTLEELKQAWIQKGFLAELESLANNFNKPFIISEIGYDSKDKTNFEPGLAWLREGSVDLQEQADCYQAALETLWGQPWLKGIFWWQWFAETYTGGPNDNGGTPWRKPAEEILKKYYLSK